MSSCRLMFPGVRSSLVFSGFGLMPLASGFQSYFYSSLKNSPSPFEDNGLLFWCLMSSPGMQKLFCGICSAFKCSFDELVGEKVVSPSYSSAILGLPYVDSLPLHHLVLQAKGLSRVFSNTTAQKHQFFSTQLSSQSNSHIHT